LAAPESAAIDGPQAGIYIPEIARAPTRQRRHKVVRRGRRCAMRQHRRRGDVCVPFTQASGSTPARPLSCAVRGTGSRGPGWNLIPGASLRVGGITFLAAVGSVEKSGPSNGKRPHSKMCIKVRSLGGAALTLRRVQRQGSLAPASEASLPARCCRAVCGRPNDGLAWKLPPSCRYTTADIRASLLPPPWAASGKAAPP
jgi:hypothetical protein